LVQAEDDGPQPVVVLLKVAPAGDTSSADEFLDAALTWFGDSDPRLGTAWEKGERLAKLIAHRRTLLILDGGCQSWSAQNSEDAAKKNTKSGTRPSCGPGGFCSGSSQKI
jgi:hypothetical protein